MVEDEMETLIQLAWNQLLQELKLYMFKKALKLQQLSGSEDTIGFLCLSLIMPNGIIQPNNAV